MTAEPLLARLDGVRKTGAGRWIARCPAHGDRRPSLSVRELDDGRVLLHDHAGCSTSDVLAAAGIAWDALFPPRPKERAAPTRGPWPASDVLACLAAEAMIVAVSALDMAHGRTLGDNDRERLLIAVNRIGHAVELAGVA